ncbi:SRPBCC family protein [Erythrobacter sp. AP23]|uniref:SRPBCC family protein n=1 Tax=Erythrobacter sp. AP23 TaxID=499656 RepID=UPI00076BE1F2|nr:SRPBCC family protein [Erythrobacter sp. AP23]KWV95829.1 hypothetical protein ASS64_00925 [Erythrobacter sp. AP23]
MNDYGRLVDANTIQFRRHFDADVETVWAFLIDPEKRKLWFCGGETDARVGGRIVFEFDHRRLSDTPPPEKYADQETARFEGEILACEPLRRLVFTWPEEEGEGTRVEIDLSKADGGGTDLVLTHRGLGSAEFRIGALAGWHAHFDLLDDIFAGIDPRDFWTRHMALEDHYGEVG